MNIEKAINGAATYIAEAIYPEYCDMVSDVMSEGFDEGLHWVNVKSIRGYIDDMYTSKHPDSCAEDTRTERHIDFPEWQIIDAFYEHELKQIGNIAALRIVDRLKANIQVNFKQGKS